MPARPTVVVVGAFGYLAERFRELYRDRYDFVTLGRPREGRQVDIALDLTDNEAIGRVVWKDRPPIDALLFCQGMDPTKGVVNTDAAHMGRMYQVSIVAPTLLVRQLAPSIRPRGAVVFLGSAAATKGSYDPAYASTKAGLQGLLPSLANVFTHVRFNQLSLGLIEGSPVHRGMSEEFVAKHKGRMFGGVLIRPENAAASLAHLIDNDNLHLANIPLIAGPAS